MARFPTFNVTRQPTVPDELRDATVEQRERWRHLFAQLLRQRAEKREADGKVTPR